MQEILTVLPLITDVQPLKGSNTIEFRLDNVEALAKDYQHSVCIGLLLFEEKSLSDLMLKHITLLLASSEETQDYGLQLKNHHWWLWCRGDADIQTSEDQMAIILDQLLSFRHYLISLISNRTYNL